MSSDPLRPDELASILRNVADGITAQAPDGRLVYANDAAAQLCGLASAEEMLSLSGAELLERFELIGEDGQPLPVAELPSRRVLQKRTTQDAVVGYRLLPGGDERWSIVRSTPILDDTGALRLVITVFHDITAPAARRGADPLPRETGRSSPPASTTPRRSPSSPRCSSPGWPTIASST